MTSFFRESSLFYHVSSSSYHGVRMDPQDSVFTASGEKVLGVQTQSEFDKSEPHSVVGNKTGDGHRSIKFSEENEIPKEKPQTKWCFRVSQA